MYNYISGCLYRPRIIATAVIAVQNKPGKTIEANSINRPSVPSDKTAEKYKRLGCQGNSLTTLCSFLFSTFDLGAVAGGGSSLLRLKKQTNKKIPETVQENLGPRALELFTMSYSNGRGCRVYLDVVSLPL